MSKDKKLNNLLGMEEYTEKDLLKKYKPTKRTDVAKDILQEKTETTGKDVFVEDKVKGKQEVEKKGLNNLISLDEFSEKEVLKDVKKTKRTEVAKDVFESVESDQELYEKWKKKVKIEKTGEHADKTIAEIKKEMKKLKGKKPFDREKFGELLFALRAKQGWKKGEGATKE